MQKGFRRNVDPSTSRDYFAPQLIGVDTLKMDIPSAARILEKLSPAFEEGSFDAPLIAKAVRSVMPNTRTSS
jgi:hypothetical protein